VFWFVVWPLLALAGFGLCALAANKINHRILPSIFVVVLTAAYVISRNFIADGGFDLAFKDLACFSVLSPW